MQSEVSGSIWRWFYWLVEGHGFTRVAELHFESFGNWVVVLQSDECGRIRIMQDRGEVDVACGPIWSPATWDVGPWYSLNTIVRYLSNGEEQLNPVAGEMEEQLEYLAEVLRANLRVICRLFSDDVFLDKKTELDALQQAIEDEIWTRILGGNQEL